MPDSPTQRLTQLPPHSLKFCSVSRRVRLDEPTNPETEQVYLTIEGTPAAFRWLAAQLQQMADTAERHSTGTSAIVSPRDLPQVELSDWSSLELTCQNRSE